MNRSNRALLIFVGVVAFASPLSAAPLTLRDCITKALKSSPDLSSLRHLVGAYKEDMTKKKSTTLPYFSSQFQSYEINGTPVTPWSAAGVFEPENGPGRRSTHWAPIAIESVGVNYPLLYEGSVFGLNDPPTVAVARAQVNQEEIQQVISEQKLVFEVVCDFIYAASYRQQRITLDRIVDRLNSELNIVENQVRLGRKLPQNASLISDERFAFEAARSAIVENEDNFLANLSNLVGANQNVQDAGIEIDGALPQLPRPPSLRTFLDEVVAAHPALQIENTKIEIARQQLRVDEANRWPTANFTTSFLAAQDLDYFSGDSTHVRPTAFQSYLTVSIPLFDFGGRRAAVSESRENLLAQRDQLRQVERDIRSSITQAFGGVLQDIATIAKFQSELEKDTEKLEMAKAELLEGESNQLTVLEGETVTLQDQLAIQGAEMSERLKFAELQNLSAGKWRWAP